MHRNVPVPDCTAIRADQGQEAAPQRSLCFADSARDDLHLGRDLAGFDFVRSCGHQVRDAYLMCSHRLIPKQNDRKEQDSV